MKRIRKIGSLLLILLLALALITACTPAKAQLDEKPNTLSTIWEEYPKTRTHIVPTVYEATTLPQAETLEQTLIRLYRETNPAVVYIIVSSRSSGSGWVYSEEGYIVTNAHVVSAGRNYEVVFASGERQRATLAGSDPDSDLAVLKVDHLPKGTEPLPLAQAEDIQVGQFAVAIGSPFGQQGSMSLGIVSGLGRSLPSQRASVMSSTYSLPQVIQTDAPINPGNSGGPLLNLRGEVIGVNAAIASATGTNSGVGFAIPVAAARQIVPNLIKKGKHVYSYMGATFDDEVSLSEQAVYGVSQTQGAYVVSVSPGGPADKAGLIGADPRTGKGGDLIVAIDGQPVTNFADLNSYLIFHTQPGQTVELTVLRGTKRVTLSLTLGARP